MPYVQTTSPKNTKERKEVENKETAKQDIATSVQEISVTYPHICQLKGMHGN